MPNRPTLKRSTSYALVAICSYVVASCTESCPDYAPAEYGTLIVADTDDGDQGTELTEADERIVGAQIRLYENDVLIDEQATRNDGTYDVGFGDACQERGSLTVHYLADGYDSLVLDWQDGWRVVGLTPVSVD